MKKTVAAGIARSPDDLLPQHDFDYDQAGPNRFASSMQDGSLVVVLDRDIAEVFKTPEAVKKALRALITAMPSPPDPGSPTRRSR